MTCCAAFQVEVLWSSGIRPLPLLRPLLVKGRNLYRMRPRRQLWADEAKRREELHKKHVRGDAARAIRDCAKRGVRLRAEQRKMLEQAMKGGKEKEKTAVKASASGKNASGGSSVSSMPAAAGVGSVDCSEPKSSTCCRSLPGTSMFPPERWFSSEWNILCSPIPRQQRRRGEEGALPGGLPGPSQWEIPEPVQDASWTAREAGGAAG